ncbi:hypothetical protein Csa_014067, partial [Cucumis sativus]
MLTLKKEPTQKRKTTTTTDDKGKKTFSYSSSSETDSPRRSYAEVLTNDSSSDSACGRFVEVAKATRDRFDLIEADIKIKYNYSGFIPAFVMIVDEEGIPFTIQTVVQAEGKWLIERNPRIHGTFTNEAAKNFNEF